jgi:hypothetical protein
MALKTRAIFGFNTAVHRLHKTSKPSSVVGPTFAHRKKRDLLQLKAAARRISSVVVLPTLWSSTTPLRVYNYSKRTTLASCRKDGA